jgi:Mechanosensitive ion channel
VDLQERLQLEAAREHVAKVKARARPWRAIFALVLALIAAAVSVQARHTADLLAQPGKPTTTAWLAPLGESGNRLLEYATAVAFFLLAGSATIGLGNKAREVLEPSIGSAHAGIVRFAVIVAGGLATIVVTLQLFNIAVTQLVVGGALTGVLVGIAAQQSLANVFAGIVLLMARPFQVGDHVGMRSGALSGLMEGTVSEVSLTYVRLETANGPVHVPNSQVLAAAVGPAGAVPAPPGQGTPPPGPGTSPAGSAAQPAGSGAQPAAAAAGSGTAELSGASGAPGPGGPAQAQPPESRSDQRDTGGQAG